jgi:O-antigen/teichoic acid export membrane protein
LINEELAKKTELDVQPKADLPAISVPNTINNESKIEKGDDFKNSSRKRTLHSSLYEVFGYGTQQILRLVSNIILARLLFPEAFGIASMVSVLLVGLTMLSDMGIEQFLIQSPHGEESKFLNTAFTVQAIRGLCLTVLMVALAQPAAWFFKEPQLAPLVYLGSIQLLAGGLRSTSIITFRRRLTIGWITALELGQSILTLVIMIPWAILKPSVFPLIAGGVISTCVYVAATHLLPVGYKNRFHWEKEAYREMNRFGRWIFGSSAVTFLGGQVDRIFYGRFIGMKWSGIYSIAANLSESVSALVNRLIGGVIYPYLSQKGRDPEADLSSAYYRIRLRIDAFAMIGTGALAGIGSWIIKGLWDERYSDAGWILRILCIKVALASISGLGETYLSALGLPRYGFWKNVSRFITVGVGIPLGFTIGGTVGAIWASAFAELPAFLIIWPQLNKAKILRIHREVLSLALFLAIFGIGYLILPSLPQFHLFYHK